MFSHLIVFKQGLKTEKKEICDKFVLPMENALNK